MIRAVFSAKWLSPYPNFAPLRSKSLEMKGETDPRVVAAAESAEINKEAGKHIFSVSFFFF
jgi:hypothetical protein